MDFNTHWHIWQHSFHSTNHPPLGMHAMAGISKEVKIQNNFESVWLMPCFADFFSFFNFFLDFENLKGIGFKSATVYFLSCTYPRPFVEYLWEQTLVHQGILVPLQLFFHHHLWKQRSQQILRPCSPSIPPIDTNILIW